MKFPSTFLHTEILALAFCGLLGGCARIPLNSVGRASPAHSGDGVKRLSPEKSQKFLREQIAEAREARRRLTVRGEDGKLAVLEDVEQQCKVLLTRNEALRQDKANALQATLDALVGRVRWHSVENSSTSSSSTSDDTTTTTEEKCKDDKDKKHKDCDHDRKDRKDCDDRRR